MRAFARTIGIDYSGAQTPNASLKGLRICLAEGDPPPIEVLPLPSPLPGCRSPGSDRAGDGAGAKHRIDEESRIMAYLQERMAHYLTCDPHLFIAEERMVRHGPHPDKDVWWIDALVVDPWQKTFFLGEATYNRSPTPLMRKVNHFYERKGEVMKRLSLEGLPEGWDVRPWLFIRQVAAPYVRARIPSGCYPKITYLEYTAFPWEYEALRREGKEPHRPYADLDERYQD
jgi:hypothetical protein